MSWWIHHKFSLPILSSRSSTGPLNIEPQDSEPLFTKRTHRVFYYAADQPQ